MYLINKSALPQEIQDTLVGGDAGDKTYADYAGLNDVYGVTSDLKVYYCSGGVETITGITVAELDTDDPAREITISDSGIAIILENLSYITRNDNGTFSAQELRSITDLTIDSSASSLADLYNLPNLQKLTISGISLSSLAGIENCPKLYYVYNYGSEIGDYTAVGKLGEQLQYLYFYNINDNELETACSKTTGIGSYDLPHLEYFAVVGNTSYINATDFYDYSNGNDSGDYSSTKSTNTITSIEPLANLTTTTKEAIEYISIENNNITSLSTLSDFTSLFLLRAEYNSLTDLTGIGDITTLQYLCVAKNSLTSLTTFAGGSELYSFCVNGNSSLVTLAGLDNCSSLYNLYAKDCNFGYGIESTTKSSSTDALASLDGKTKLYLVDLRNNSNLVWIEYLSNCTAIRVLKLDGCTGINSNSMYAIKSIIDTCGTKASYDSSYSLALLSSTTTVLDLSGQTLKQDQFESIGNQTQLTHLSLKNVVIEDDDENEITNENDAGETTSELDELVTSVLSNLTAMKYLQLYGMSNLSTIDFVENMESLKELDIMNTSITDLSLLEEMTEETEEGNSTFVLNTLAVNASGTNLGDIPKTVSSLSSSSYWISRTTNTWGGGLLCTVSAIWETLENSSITCLRAEDSSSGLDYLDLTGCSSLEQIYVWSGSSIYLPACIKIVYTVTASFVFDAGTELSLVSTYSSSSYKSILDSLVGVQVSSVNLFNPTSDYFWGALSALEGTGISSFSTSFYAVSLGDLSDVVLPSSLSSLRISVSSSSYSIHKISGEMNVNCVSAAGSKLKTLSLPGVGISDLTFLNNLTELTTVDLRYNSISTLEGVTSTLPNVTSLNLSYNSITSLYGIQYFTGLKTLNLSYNTSLGDTCSYGGTTYFNLQLLSDLRTNNQTLTSINLTGCTDLNTDSANSYWTTLTGLSGLTVTGP